MVSYLDASENIPLEPPFFLLPAKGIVSELETTSTEAQSCHLLHLQRSDAPIPCPNNDDP